MDTDQKKYLCESVVEKMDFLQPTPSPARTVEKFNGEASSGSGSLSVSVSNGHVMGFEHEKPGPHVAVLTQLGAEVWAVDEGKVPSRAGIDPDSDPDFDFDNDRTDRTDRTDRVLLPGG